MIRQAGLALKANSSVNLGVKKEITNKEMELCNCELKMLDKLKSNKLAHCINFYLYSISVLAFTAKWSVTTGISDHERISIARTMF